MSTGSAASMGEKHFATDPLGRVDAATTPGRFAGEPTGFDVVGRSLMATRAALLTALEQIDTTLAALYLIAPESYREQMRGALGEVQRSPGAEPPEPPGQPATFMSKQRGAL